MRRMLSASVIVVSFETREHLARCLASVEDDDLDVIVVDNASTDGSVELVRERFPAVRLVALDHNVGFGQACNLGVQIARSELLLILNADTVVRPNALAELVDHATRAPRTGGVAPLLVDGDGHAQLSSVPYPTKWWMGRPAFTSFPESSARPDSRAGMTLEGAFPAGAALLLVREAFDEVGGFDPGFFLFYEEVDLCRRLQDRGWTILLSPTAEVEHAGGASTRPRWAQSYPHQLRGHLRFLAKHEGLVAARIARLVLLAAVTARSVFARGDNRRAFRAGVRWLASANIDAVTAPVSRRTEPEHVS